MARTGQVLHANIRFDTHARASVNAQFSGTAKPGEAPGADIDVPVKKGSALDKAIRHVGQLLTAETAKLSGHKLTMHSGEDENAVDVAGEAGTAAARRPAKKSK